jgi:hypothetical protein
MSLIITDGQPRGLGYLEIDHRAAEMALPPGVARHFEADTYTCTHCERVVVLNPQRRRERYKCSGCNHHVCDECAAKRVAGGSCRTMAQFVEEIRDRDARQPESSSIILP